MFFFLVRTLFRQPVQERFCRHCRHCSALSVTCSVNVGRCTRPASKKLRWPCCSAQNPSVAAKPSKTVTLLVLFCTEVKDFKWNAVRVPCLQLRREIPVSEIANDGFGFCIFSKFWLLFTFIFMFIHHCRQRRCFKATWNNIIRTSAYTMYLDGWRAMLFFALTTCIHGAAYYTRSLASSQDYTLHTTHTLHTTRTHQHRRTVGKGLRTSRCRSGKTECWLGLA